ncbi:MAG: redox-sensing transcriptional repressor Rex [Eubacteriales bacterium]
MLPEKRISMAVIKRLPRYYRYLGDLLENDVIRISSKELSERMKVTASQIRQDLNNFGGFGQQGYGYNVEHLYKEIGKILGLQNKYNMVIVGVGNLGQALANYTDFDKRGFVVKGLFDVNPRLIGLAVRGIEILDVDELERFVKDNDIRIAALTLPKQKAPKIASDLIKWGIQGIWNFSPVDLNLTKDVVIENVHLLDSLMTLSYTIKDRKIGKEKKEKKQI